MQRNSTASRRMIRWKARSVHLQCISTAPHGASTAVQHACHCNIALLSFHSDQQSAKACLCSQMCQYYRYKAECFTSCSSTAYVQGAQLQLPASQRACCELRVHSPYGVLARHAQGQPCKVTGMVLLAGPGVRARRLTWLACAQPTQCCPRASCCLCWHVYIMYSMHMYIMMLPVSLPGSSMAYLHLLSICPVLCFRPGAGDLIAADDKLPGPSPVQHGTRPTSAFGQMHTRRMMPGEGDSVLAAAVREIVCWGQPLEAACTFAARRALLKPDSKGVQLLQMLVERSSAVTLACTAVCRTWLLDPQPVTTCMVHLERCPQPCATRHPVQSLPRRPTAFGVRHLHLQASHSSFCTHEKGRLCRPACVCSDRMHTCCVILYVAAIMHA
jgi:hypothetical protein